MRVATSRFLPAGDKDALSAAVLLPYKDSLETENICKMAPFRSKSLGATCILMRLSSKMESSPYL